MSNIWGGEKTKNLKKWLTKREILSRHNRKKCNILNRCACGLRERPCIFSWIKKFLVRNGAPSHTELTITPVWLVCISFGHILHVVCRANWSSRYWACYTGQEEQKHFTLSVWPGAAARTFPLLQSHTQIVFLESRPTETKHCEDKERRWRIHISYWKASALLH